MISLGSLWRQPAALQALDGVLRVTVVLACLGSAWWSLRLESPVVGWLCSPAETGGLEWSEGTALSVDRAAGWMLIAAAALTLLGPCWPVLLGVAAWHVLVPLAETIMGGHFLSAWTLPAHAARIAAPLALAAIEPWPGRFAGSRVRLEGTVWLLRVAAACTFAVHGYEALRLNPQFIDYLIAAADRCLGWKLPESQAVLALNIIGVVDVLAAAGLLVARLRWLAAYMAFWGTVTALARVVYAGLPVGYETLVRAAHAGVPLAICLYWHLGSRPSTPSPTQPDHEFTPPPQSAAS